MQASINIRRCGGKQQGVTVLDGKRDGGEDSTDLGDAPVAMHRPQMALAIAMARCRGSAAELREIVGRAPLMARQTRGGRYSGLRSSFFDRRRTVRRLRARATMPSASRMTSGSPVAIASSR